MRVVINESGHYAAETGDVLVDAGCYARFDVEMS
jgi:hypothetical protein